MGQGTSQDQPVPALLSSLRQPHGHAAAAPLKRDYIRKFNTLPGHVCPTEEEDKEASKAVDRVVKLLHQQLRPAARVDRVHVGGSFGRRTSVRFRFDVDLLLFVNGLNADDKGQVQRLLQQVKEVLVAGRVSDGTIKLRPELCMVQLTSRGVEMDVLLVRNELVSPGQGVDRARVQRDVLVGPLRGMSDQAVRAMAQKPVDRARERGVVEALTKYVARQHTTANQAVRVFKAWVKVGLAEGGRLRSKKLPSVALELIVLRAYEQEVEAGGPSDTLLLRTFISALQLARDLRGGWLSGAPVVMLDAGPDLGYRRRDGLRYRECWGPAPHVIHPIDPTCNVASVPAAHRRKPPWDWHGLAREAGALLDVILGGNWEQLVGQSTLGAALRRLDQEAASRK